MRIYLGLVLLLIVKLSFSQTQVDFSTIDRYAAMTDATTVDALTFKLTASYKTDLEKVRAIFRWITEHIEYNTTVLAKTRKTAMVSYEEPDDTSAVLKPLTERVAQIVLQKRKSVCEGYAKLFKSLCDHAGIRSEVICGYAKPNLDRQSLKFKTNHSWNAVYVDSSWHLLDVTWASGFTTYSSNEFIRSFDEYYFFTPAQYFIRDHYPEDLQWTLLTDPPTLREFYQSPFRYTGFIKQRVISFLPAKGIIEATAGDSIRFEIATENGQSHLLVTDSLPGDVDLDNSRSNKMTPAPKTVVIYQIPVNAKPWLYVICNGEIVLRYKLNLKKEESLSKK
jgi:transglutaminase/protease-like cytokinesis protein 3